MKMLCEIKELLESYRVLFVLLIRTQRVQNIIIIYFLNIQIKGKYRILFTAHSDLFICINLLSATRVWWKYN